VNRFAAALIAAAAAALLGCGGAPAVAAGPAAGDTRLWLMDLDQAPHDWATVAPQFAVVELNSWNTAALAAVRAASPGTKVVEYKDLQSVRANDCGTSPGGGQPCVVNGVICPAGVDDAPYYAGGLGFCATWRSHPEWFLTNDGTTATAATPLSDLHVMAGFPDSYQTDYGNPAYQAAWAQAVSADVAASGWDGVKADNAITTAAAYGTVPAYPTDASVQAAMGSMLATVGPAVTGTGAMIVPNLGHNNVYPGVWARWLPYVSGLVNEFSWYWAGPSAQSVASWSAWMEPEVAACAAQGKACFFHVAGHGDTLTAAQATFATASYLLYADGGSYVEYPPDTAAAGTVTALGDALGPATVSGGTYARQFAGGTVTVTPAAGTAAITTGGHVRHGRR